MDETVFEKLKTIKKEMSEAEKRAEQERMRRKRAEEEATVFERMMQAEGTKKIGDREQKTENAG
ncbi:hypothetical protein [Hydrogenimonas urashimensis]|uniref:hypothetical protein n=1 Tax=Hydrogenimonas urashimensis TaxID=2740515 RepID=UPI00191607DF|nr:hypothetical protein [Hydrogenimonas urashimensis]